jgi:hypothetical protein
MGDWPEFELSGATATTWTREGDGRRYVEGLLARLNFVEHPWKTPGKPLLGDLSKIVLNIEIEESLLRSSGIAPGPGGHGYEMARRHGDAVHYLLFQSSESADRAAADLEESGVTIRKWGSEAIEGWFIGVWHRDPSSAEEWQRKT